MPAWCFKVDGQDFAPFKNVLTKAIIETKTRVVASAVSDDADTNWLNAAVIAESDVEMVDSSQASENSQIDIDEIMFDADEFNAYEELELSEA